jgi:ribulose-phosphate 3-epimerase
MCNLEKQIDDLEKNGITMLHIDILDGHFSPSMPLGFETVKQLRKKTNLFFDCHVMAEEPDYFIDELLEIGVQHICFHAETCPHIDGMLNKIHDAGVLAGVALKPSTPINILEYVIEKCDSILLMLINPGYASSKNEKQVLYANKKIMDLRRLINSRKLKTKIEIDGRISLSNIEQYGKDMVDIFVCGTTCFNRNDIKKSSNELFNLKEKICR